jgi:hypothetical protein
MRRDAARSAAVAGPRAPNRSQVPGDEGIVIDMGDDTRSRDDERLLARAEEVLTEIKVANGLSEPHAAVLAALRIRLKGDPGTSLDDLIAAAEDHEGPQLGEVIEPMPTPPSSSLDDLLSKPEKPKRSLDDLLG